MVLKNNMIFNINNDPGDNDPKPDTGNGPKPGNGGDGAKPGNGPKPGNGSNGAKPGNGSNEVKPETTTNREGINDLSVNGVKPGNTPQRYGSYESGNNGDIPYSDSGYDADDENGYERDDNNGFESTKKSLENGIRNGTIPQEIVSITYEEIGFFPRSFSRVLDRFLKQVFLDVENLVIQEYRFYRYLFLTTLKCVLILFFVPFLVNFFAKAYIVRPVADYFWNSQQHEIFINSYQLNHAVSEVRNFEEKLYFESLLVPSSKASYRLKQKFSPVLEAQNKESFEQRLQDKTLELAIRYNNESVEALTNFFADLLSFVSLWYLVIALDIQINITKSFLLEVFFGLDDTKKSLLILLFTDLLVGYHSSNLWELFFEFLFTHYGLPESQTGIFLLVATLPVLLDVLFKYVIFRHLNRSSPATVATYRAMIE